MKAGIHPATRPARITCAGCGSTFTTRSTTAELTVEACSRCHPAYTGRPARQAGGSRIARFEERRARAVRI